MDFIHTSNLADPVGLLPLLLCCPILLKGRNSILMTGIVNAMMSCQTVEEYIELHFGSNRIGLLPSLFGVHLADDLDLRTRACCADQENLYWTKANDNGMKLSITDSPDLKCTIMHVVERFLLGDINIHSFPGQVVGSSGSPLGALILLKRLAPYIQDDLEHLIAEVAAVDRTRLDRTIQKNDALLLSFKAMAAALGCTSVSASQECVDELLCLELPAVPGSQNPYDRPIVGASLIGTVVFFELTLDDMKRFELEGVTAPEAVADSRLLNEKSCHYFMNYKHDAKRQTIEILMLRSDWEELPQYTMGFVFLKSNVFSEACFVKQDAEIRKLNTTLEPPQTILQDSSDTVQISGLTEDVDSYTFQLNMKNEGAKVEVNTVPPREERCNRLQLEMTCVTWPTPERVDIGFSSNIDINRTEVSSKRDVIKVRVAKHSLYTAGLYLLPKYTLTLSTFPQATIATLNSHLFEPRKLIDKMIRGFENNPTAFLRDTLKCIWSNVITNPEIKRYTFGQNTRGVFDIELFVGPCYIMNDTPLIHVTYLKREVILPLIKEGQLSMGDLKEERSRRQSTDRHSRSKSSQKHISVNKNELDLWKKLLRYNSHVTEQPSHVKQADWITESFLQLYFPRSKISPDAFLRSMFAETFLRTEEPKLPRKVQEPKFWERNPPGIQSYPTRTSTTQAHHTVVGRDAVTERCGYCGEYNDDNMLCTGCRRVYYCSRNCQKKDRKTHKPACKKHEEPVT